ENVRKRSVVILFLGNGFFSIIILRRLVICFAGLIGHLRVALLLDFGLGLLICRADESALDPNGAIVIEDHESATACNVVRIIGLTLRSQPLDFGLKLAELCIYV